MFVIMNRVLSAWNDIGIEKISQFLEWLKVAYSHNNRIPPVCDMYLHDCLLAQGKFQEFLDITLIKEPKDLFSTNGNLSSLCCNVSLHLGQQVREQDLVRMFPYTYNKVTKENPHLFAKIFGLCKESSEQEGEWLQRSIDNKSNNESIMFGLNPSSYFLFQGHPFNDPKLPFQYYRFYASRGLNSVVSETKRLAENLLRDELVMPRIGEGWISETELFNKIRDHFTSTEIIQHGSPRFLKGQHFDVWIPEYKVAVEYHGKQHFEPVEFFGGEEGYQNTVERDKRKLRICIANAVKLIVVEEGYDFEKLTRLIDSEILN